MSYFYKLLVLGKGTPDVRSKLQVLPQCNSTARVRTRAFAVLHPFQVDFPSFHGYTTYQKKDLAIFCQLRHVIVLWNSIPADAFPERPNIQRFKRCVNMLDMTL